MPKEEVYIQVSKEEPSVGNEPQDSLEDKPLDQLFETEVASSQKQKYKRRKEKQSVPSSAKAKGKDKVDQTKTEAVPGTTIHVIEESDEEIEPIKPDQYRQIALSAYETHLRKIEVKIIEIH